MKRIVLFLLTNLAVMLVLSIVTSVLGLNRYLSAYGMNYTSLMAFSMLFGFTGSIISLLMSKGMAKRSMGLTMITEPRTAEEVWIVQTVQHLAEKAGIGMPEVGIYEGAPNAFATGAFKNSALVAVSTGLLRGMTREEVEAVLGHEVAHIANGDMVTMTLIQGVVNTFVIFLSRAISFAVDGSQNRGEERRGPGFFVTRMVLELLLGFLASMIVAWFSRQREFRADAGAGDYMGQRNSMINALRRLGSMQPGEGDLPKNLQTMGITGSIGKLFATHPPLEERIARLQQPG